MASAVGHDFFGVVAAILNIHHNEFKKKGDFPHVKSLMKTFPGFPEIGTVWLLTRPTPYAWFGSRRPSHRNTPPFQGGGVTVV